MALPVYTATEVAKHNKDGDLWLMIGGKVYDVSKFGDEHPGGLDILLESAGIHSFIQYNLVMIVYLLR